MMQNTKLGEKEIEKVNGGMNDTQAPEDLEYWIEADKAWIRSLLEGGSTPRYVYTSMSGSGTVMTDINLRRAINEIATELGRKDLL